MKYEGKDKKRISLKNTTNIVKKNPPHGHSEARKNQLVYNFEQSDLGFRTYCQQNNIDELAFQEWLVERGKGDLGMGKIKPKKISARKSYTEKEKKKHALRFYASGLSQTEYGKKYKIDRSAINRWIKKYPKETASDKKKVAVIKTEIEKPTTIDESIYESFTEKIDQLTIENNKLKMLVDYLLEEKWKLKRY